MNSSKRVLAILFGNFCTAVGTVFFIVPSGLITGGVTGFALALTAYRHIPVSYGIAIISVLLLLLGWVSLGRNFAASSALSAISFPACVWICEQAAKVITFRVDDLMMNLVCAALMFGYGVALVMKQGASTGGLDTISMILYKKRGISLVITVNMLEVLSMLPQMGYSGNEQILGGFLLTIFYTTIMNYFISKEVAQIQVMIYSQQFEKILEFIDKELHRGSTLFRVQGGYTREDTFALQTIISNRELFQLKEKVLELDAHAFMTISEVSRVNGKGFTLDSDVPGDARKGKDLI